jgi:hypothetical protein
MMRAGAVLAGALALFPTLLPAVCDSRVFIDANRNGVFDAGERGLSGVAVSDGVHIVRSDRDGRYRLAAMPGKTLFVIKPSGYSLPKRADGLPDFFANQAGPGAKLRYGGVVQSDTACKSFALNPEAPNPELPLSVLVFGDPQPKSAVDVDYYLRDIIAPLRGNPAATLGISLGDIVHDDLTLLPEIKKADSLLGIPRLYAAGNHDIDFDAAGDAGSLESFRAQFGPDTFAWEERHANFIVLDDVIYRPGGKPAYIGGLRESQFHFLARYLAGADKNKLLVISAHIPFFQTKDDAETFRSADRRRLFKLLAPFRDVLLLTAHSHAQNIVQHGPDSDWHGVGRLFEYNAGASCGGYWAGVKDKDGLPDATMSDGTPNGYARLHISPRDYRLQWFNARNRPNAAMALHLPLVLRHGAYPGVGLYANVFMARPDAHVDVRIDDGAWQPMQRISRADPRVLALNLQDDASPALMGYDRTPEATISSHLWRFSLPTDLAPGEHRIRVRAIDAWLGEVSEDAVYRLEAVSP